MANTQNSSLYLQHHARQILISGKEAHLWCSIHSNLCWQKRRSTAQYRAQSLQVGHGGVGTGRGGVAHLEQCILSS